MALFRRLFYRGPPDGVVEISSNILVFDHCFSTDYVEEDELKPHIGGVLKQLLGRYSIDSFMVFNFEGCKGSQTAHIFSEYNMSMMGYPSNYEGCPLLTMEMIHHFLRSGESWLSLAPDNLLLIHSEQGGWPVLAFALAALLIYLRRYTDERKALEMVHKQAPPELIELYSPLDPSPSHLRYLNYVSRRYISPVSWPPDDKILNLNCAVIRKVPNVDAQGGCKPIFRIYGTDPLTPDDNSAKVLFSTPKTSDFVQLYTQEDNEIIKANVWCPVQGDVVMECLSLDEDFEHEVMIFRVMFSTAFIVDNLLLLDRDQIDILWDTIHRFPVDFRVEVIFTEIDPAASIQASESCSEKEIFSKVDVAFGHLELSSKSDHLTNAAPEQKGLNSAYAGFDVIPLQETEISNATPEHSLLHSRSAQASQLKPAHSHSPEPKFEGDRDTTADSFSIPEAFEGDRDATADAENLKPNGQEHELTKYAAAEWSDTNTDTPSGTPSSSSPSSPQRKFDKYTMEAGASEAQAESTEPQ